MTAALAAVGHPCAPEVERRIREGDVEQALLVAQSDDIAALRALQERLTALDCAAFVSESTSWRARLWEGLSAAWRGGLSAVFTAKSRAVLLAVVIFLTLLAAFAGLAGLASRDSRDQTASPMERLTEVRAGARGPGRGDDSPERPSTQPQSAAGAVGGAVGASDDVVRDPTATPLEVGAFFAGLFVALGLGALLARRLRAPGRRLTRAAQAAGLALFAFGLWAGTRPREIVREVGLAGVGAGGLTQGAGNGSIDLDDTPDASDTDGDGGVTPGAAGSRALRGPFDRFVRSIAIQTAGTPAPTFTSLMESLRAAPPPTPSTPAPTADHQGEQGPVVGDAAQPADAGAAPPAATTRHHARSHDDSPPSHEGGRRHEAHHADRRERASRHGRRHGSASNAPPIDAGVAASTAGDAGARHATAADASASSVTLSRSRVAAASAPPTQGTSAGGSPPASVRGGAGGGRRPTRSAEQTTVEVLRERPRLGPWFLVGLVAGAMLSRRPRRAVEETG